MLCLVLSVYFKQKPAYDMRISDWSSDVFSSGLRLSRAGPLAARSGAAARLGDGRNSRFLRSLSVPVLCRTGAALRPADDPGPGYRGGGIDPASGGDAAHARPAADDRGAVLPRLRLLRKPPASARSEEHTSELQSLMRTS